MNTIDLLIHSRKLLHKTVVDLPPEAWLTIPDGFDNNIAWNVGHINVTQQGMIYRGSGLPTYTEKTDARMYRPGSSPATWIELGVEPDIPRLLEQTSTFADLLEQDYAAGKFTQFTPYTVMTEAEISNIEDAIAFNNFHEGLHIGAILSILNLI